MLYRDGKGLFPLPLAHAAELPVDRLEPAPDLQVDDALHLPRVCRQAEHVSADGGRGAVLRGAEGLAAAARFDGPRGGLLRNGAPLVVERSFGKGRVMAFLTTAAPDVEQLGPQSELRRGHAGPSGVSRAAGRPTRRGRWARRWSWIWIRPSISRKSDSRRRRAREPTTAANATLTPQGRLAVSLGGADTSGFYEVQLTRIDGKSETRHYAFNVDPTEGNLAALGAEQLASRLEGVKYQYDQAAAFQSAAGDSAGYNLTRGDSLWAGAAAVGRADLGLVGQLPRGATPPSGPGRRRMMHASWLLWAEGDCRSRTTFEWGRIQSNADWILPIAACLAILLFVRYCIVATRSNCTRCWVGS